MKHPSENELGALLSGFIGVMGVSILLIPARLNIFNADTSIWVIVALGISAYLISTSVQIVSILQVPQKRALFIQGTAAFFLFIFTGLLARAEYFIEAIIFFYIAVMQLILLTPLKVRFSQTSLLKTAFILISISSGAYLAISGSQYANIDITLYKTPLAVGFFGSSLFGIIAILLPSCEAEG